MRGIWTARVAVIAAVVLFIHLGLSPNLRVAGVAAELPLGLSIAAGLSGGVERGVVFGFLFGLIVDLFLFTPIGLSALIYGVVGWIAGHVFMDRVEESPIMSAISVGLGTAAGLTVFVALGVALGESSLLEASVARIILIASIMNGVFAVALMGACHWMWFSDPLRDSPFGAR